MFNVYEKVYIYAYAYVYVYVHIYINAGLSGIQSVRYRNEITNDACVSFLDVVAQLWQKRMVFEGGMEE
jgi:hypothetical protein